MASYCFVFMDAPVTAKREIHCPSSPQKDSGIVELNSKFLNSRNETHPLLLLFLLFPSLYLFSLPLLFFLLLPLSYFCLKISQSLKTWGKRNCTFLLWGLAGAGREFGLKAKLFRKLCLQGLIWVSRWDGWFLGGSAVTAGVDWDVPGPSQQSLSVWGPNLWNSNHMFWQRPFVFLLYWFSLYLVIKTHPVCHWAPQLVTNLEPRVLAGPSRHRKREMNALPLHSFALFQRWLQIDTAPARTRDFCKTTIGINREQRSNLAQL